MPLALEPSARSRSCAECRRLKLKCDKNRPCSSCRRRRCASICPQGRMVSKGTRFILASTEQLHDKIEALIVRVRQLEDALEISHALHANEPHFLLKEELRLVAASIDTTLVPESEPGGKEEELADSMGMLTLDMHGSRYFGPTGVFTALWRDEDDRHSSKVKHKGVTSRALSEFPPEIAQIAHAFPIPLPAEDTSHMRTWILENGLPSYEEAWSLFENYWEHYAWHFAPFARAAFVDQILSPLYHQSPDNGDKPLGHRLALLFVVFAIGEFMDLTHPLDYSSGLRYYLLSRASLFLDSVFDAPSVTALQAMHLMGLYYIMSRGTCETEYPWVFSGLNAKIAFTLGLHHDASKFHIPAVEVEARQLVLAAVYGLDILLSLYVGRPSCYAFANVNGVFPKASENATEDSLVSCWIPNFIWDCLAKTLDTVVCNKATSYSAILQLDSKIRQYVTHVPVSHPSEIRSENVGTIMRHTMGESMPEICLLFLHRRYFALALRNSPDDPLKSPLAPSVLACHRGAANFLSKVRMIHSVAPAFAIRVWPIWPNAFIATLILGSIVARSPRCSLAASALLEFELACQLWEASYSVCSPRVLDTVRKLKQKAFMAFAQNQAAEGPLSASPEVIEVSEELHALGAGGSRVMASTPPYTPEQTFPSIPSQSSPSQGSASNRAQDMYVSGGHESGYPQFTDAFPGVSFSSMAPPADFAISEVSPYLPEDFEELFQTMAATAPTQPPGVVLEELGLGSEWQPVMDDLGL